MKISAIKIFNIRSFLDKDNYLTLEDTKTAIIGVNESGKSNILEAIGKLNFTSRMSNFYNTIKNLSVPEEDVKILVELRLSNKEMEELRIQDDKKRTLLTFVVGQATMIDGSLQLAISENESVKKAIEYFENHKLAELYNINNDNRTNYNNALSLIKNCSCEIVELSKLDILTKNFKAGVDNVTCIERVNDLKEFLNKVYMMFPVILYKQWNGVTPIKASYINTEAVKELADVNSSLHKLTKAAQIKIDDMKQAFEMSEGNKRQTLRYRIEKNIGEHICKEFKKFYDKDNKSDLNILVKFEANKLLVNVATGEMVMSIDERSNGLRWYLGLFVELVAMDYRDRDIIYLLDEPGVFLHVNAQKELLSLFDDLCENRGQLVYTTHLPYMLDTENIYCIRRVEKDYDGQSHIYNRVYSGGVALPSRQETLTPLIQAMGCNMKYSTDIAARTIIITEGITDRMYLEAGKKALDISEQINFIPSNGVTAIPNIVSIMTGWGCDYKVVLDYDSEGFTVYNRLLKNFGQEISKKIIFVVDGDVPKDVNNRTIETKTIEYILSEEDMNNLETPFDGTDATKTLTAVEFRSKVINGDINIDETTRKNYQRLFDFFVLKE